MRVFFAINLPDFVTSSFQIVRDTMRGIRWIPSSNVHLTLRFLGEQTEERVSEAIKAASEPAVEAFNLRLAGTGAFPDVRRPSVLWVGVDDAERLAHLHAEISQSLQRWGFTLEKRAFRPHVTIGRVRRSHRVDVTEWASRHAAYRSDTFRITAFHLIASRLQTDGPSYTTIAAFSLT
jgi:2'-5' RNA ligase